MTRVVMTHFKMQNLEYVLKHSNTHVKSLGNMVLIDSLAGSAKRKIHPPTNPHFLITRLKKQSSDVEDNGPMLA